MFYAVLNASDKKINAETFTQNSCNQKLSTNTDSSDDVHEKGCNLKLSREHRPIRLYFEGNMTPGFLIQLTFVTLGNQIP